MTVPNYPISPSQPLNTDIHYSCRHCERHIHPQDWALTYCLECDVYVHRACAKNGSCPVFMPTDPSQA